MSLIIHLVSPLIYLSYDQTQRQKSSGFTSHDQGQQLSVTQIHHRKWFASITDNVLVGKLSCINTGDESSDLR